MQTLKKKKKNPSCILNFIFYFGEKGCREGGGAVNPATISTAVSIIGGF